MAASVPEDSVYEAINHRQPCLDFGLVPGRGRRQEGGVARGPGLLLYQQLGLPGHWERPGLLSASGRAFALAESPGLGTSTLPKHLNAEL